MRNAGLALDLGLEGVDGVGGLERERDGYAVGPHEYLSVLLCCSCRADDTEESRSKRLTHFCKLMFIVFFGFVLIELFRSFQAYSGPLSSKHRSSHAGPLT